MVDYEKHFPIDGPYSKVSKHQKGAIMRVKSHLQNGFYNTESIDCICSNEGGILIGKYDRYGIPLDTLACTECGLFRSSPNLDAKSILHFYENEYRKIYGPSKKPFERNFQKQVSHGKKIIDFISDQINIDSSTKVLDIGCASGGVLLPFISQGAHVTGFDFDKDYLEFGQSYGLPIYHAIEHDSSQKYDMIILNHVLEHMREPIMELESLRTQLTDDGLIYIEVPGIYDIKSTYGSLNLYFQNAHFWHFVSNTLKNVASTSGLEPVKNNEKVQALFKAGKKKIYQRDESITPEILNFLIEEDLV
ncbi:MAG: class I SAM-dependent methyltransferase [Nanobdellota archaeon]